VAEKFSEKLRWWRHHRGIPQLELAARAGLSQRHLSFLELGRASPSREMVDRLAAALDIPMRQHNALLGSAGFAPLWRQSDLGEADVAEVASALKFMLDQQEPYPAVVVDRHWNLLKSNAAAVRLVEFLVGPISPDADVNLADALISPDVLKPHLVNWADVARHFLRSVETDAAADGSPETLALLERLKGYKGVEEALEARPTQNGAGPVLAMHFSKGDTSLNLFTTIATLGTPQDITLQELRIENFFPLDEKTAGVMRGWAGSTT
jgi:transcriptional regulator with XRE-family HTH domain